MKKVKDIPEDEVVALFLQSEINSNRWSDTILKLLSQEKMDRRIVDKADINNTEENIYRKKLLGDFRGYRKNKLLFTDFPDTVQWIMGTIHKDELEKVKYMKYSYWNALSKHTRLAKVGAETVKEGTVIFNESNEGFFKASKVLKSGVKFPRLILVGKDEQSDLVVLEGHQRITAYFLNTDTIPNELEVIIGYSKNMDQWGGY